MPTKRHQDVMDLKHVGDKKASKPLMEKRRRARINHCLAQLKSLVIDPNTTERSRQAKLEKADILELTVRHLHEIKRRQRTASLLNSRNPKKKFEIGYAECVREVDLFLSTLMDSQLSGLEAELQRRLKDHLGRRLQDLRNIEPLADNIKNEAPDDLNSLPSSPSSSSSSINENSPSSRESSENYCSGDSPTHFRGQLRYRTDERADFKQRGIQAGMSVFQRSQFLDVRENDPSDQSTQMPYMYRPVPPLESNDAQPLDRSSCTLSPNSCDTADERNALSSKESLEALCSPASETKPRNLQPLNNQFFSYPTEHGKENGMELNMYQMEQISLVPRRLPNGDWALVIPANLATTGNETSYPFSAFRLVWPSSQSDSDLEQQNRQQYVASPLSSALSDVSAEEFYCRTEGDFNERMENSSQNGPASSVWRPW